MHDYFHKANFSSKDIIASSLATPSIYFDILPGLTMVIKHDSPDHAAATREHVDQLDQITAERDGLHIPEVDTSGYRVREEPFGTRRKIRVVLMGAGASTVNFLKKAEETMQNLDVKVYEKNYDVGGTWLENRYPGCACDVC